MPRILQFVFVALRPQIISCNFRFGRICVSPKHLLRNRAKANSYLEVTVGNNKLKQFELFRDATTGP